MTIGPAKMPGGANRLSRIAIAVVSLAALCGCGAGVSVGGSSAELERPTELETPTAAEIEGTLNRLSQQTKPPEPFSFGGAVVTCTALGCPVPDAIHVNHVRPVHGRLDFSGFDFIERRRAVSLATKSRSSGMGDHFISRRTLGGWMEHGFFLVETLHEGPHADFSYRTYYMGRPTPTKPAVSVSGTWSGVMAGVMASSSDDDAVFVRGDATVTVAYPGGSRAALVDVEFASITREDTGARISNISWENLALEGGQFAAGNVLHNHGDGYFGTEGFPASRGGGVFGQFYGPNHEEIGGLFHREGLAGAFGANRND
ncbi:MAG: hypothetical protein OXF11_17535 [Deltaproteobacteria bacterium]|nr:hypothetical protein [Deltaproteobacteria bacterium]